MLDGSTRPWRAGLPAHAARVGRGGFADEIMKTMKSAGWGVRESDPFSGATALGARLRIARLNAMWEIHRERVRPGDLVRDSNSFIGHLVRSVFQLSSRSLVRF